MGGFFDDFDLDPDDVKEPEGFKNAEDGAHEYEIIKVDKYEKGGEVKTRIHYRLDDNPKEVYTEWFRRPNEKGTDLRDKKVQSGLSWFKKRLGELGVDPSTAGPDDLVGLTGSFILATRQGTDGKDYQGIKLDSMRPDGYTTGDRDVEPPKAPEKPKRTRKPAAAKPAPEEAAVGGPGGDDPVGGDPTAMDDAAQKDTGRPAVLDDAAQKDTGRPAVLEDAAQKDDEDYDPFA